MHSVNLNDNHVEVTGRLHSENLTFFRPECGSINISTSVRKRPRGRRGGAKHRTRRTRIQTEHAKAIAKYHALEKQIARAPEHEREALRSKQRALGGLAAYQDQSTTGGAAERGGESAKWSAKFLMSIWPFKRRIRLLDVGAIAGTAYTKWRHKFDVTSIDLHPRAPHVIKSDFFDFPVPAREDDLYDVIGLSLVINFVGDLKQRGDMLLHAHLFLRRGGYLYVVLPLACVENSRYMTHEHFKKLVHSAGYDVVRNEDSQRLTRWLLQEKEPHHDRPLKSSEEARSAFWDGTTFTKRELRSGALRNNFCIRLA